MIAESINVQYEHNGLFLTKYHLSYTSKCDSYNTKNTFNATSPEDLNTRILWFTFLVYVIDAFDLYIK